MMRRLLIALWLACCSSYGWSQCDCSSPDCEHRYGTATRRGSIYQHPRESCGCRSCQRRHLYIVQHKQCEECDEQPVTPESSRRQPEPQQSVGIPGVYAAPPQDGVEVESGTSAGVGGFAIRFPEIRLELPSIDFPRITRYRHSRKMQLERGVAPYVQAPSQQPMMGTHMAAMPAQFAQPIAQESTRRIPVVEPESAKRQEIEKESAQRDDINDVCHQVEQIQKELEIKEQQLEQQMSKLQECLERLNRTRVQTQRMSQPCGCAECQSKRRQQDRYLDGPELEPVPRQPVPRQPPQPEPPSRQPQRQETPHEPTRPTDLPLSKNSKAPNRVRHRELGRFEEQRALVPVRRASTAPSPREFGRDVRRDESVRASSHEVSASQNNSRKPAIDDHPKDHESPIRRLLSFLPKGKKP